MNKLPKGKLLIFFLITGENITNMGLSFCISLKACPEAIQELKQLAVEKKWEEIGLYHPNDNELTPKDISFGAIKMLKSDDEDFFKPFDAEINRLSKKYSTTLFSVYYSDSFEPQGETTFILNGEVVKFLPFKWGLDYYFDTKLFKTGNYRRAEIG